MDTKIRVQIKVFWGPSMFQKPDFWVNYKCRKGIFSKNQNSDFVVHWGWLPIFPGTRKVSDLLTQFNKCLEVVKYKFFRNWLIYVWMLWGKFSVDAWWCLMKLNYTWWLMMMLDDDWWHLMTLDDAWWWLMMLDDAWFNMRTLIFHGI